MLVGQNKHLPVKSGGELMSGERARESLRRARPHARCGWLEGSVCPTTGSSNSPKPRSRVVFKVVVLTAEQSRQRDILLVTLTAGGS